MPESARCGRANASASPATPAHAAAADRSSARVDTVLGFDYGTRRIGVAVGNGLSGARALTVVGNGAAGPDWARLDELLSQWRPATLLVGLPLTLDGGEQATSRAARTFAATLEHRYALPVRLVDERLSSREAAGRFAAQRRQGQARRKHAAALDALAAQIIVESWLRESPQDQAPCAARR